MVGKTVLMLRLDIILLNLLNQRQRKMVVCRRMFGSVLLRLPLLLLLVIVLLMMVMLLLFSCFDSFYWPGEILVLAAIKKVFAMNIKSTYLLMIWIHAVCSDSC